MSIKIVYEEFTELTISNNIFEKVRIIKIDGLKHSELPLEYFNQKYNIFKTQICGNYVLLSTGIFHPGNYIWLTESHIYSKKDFIRRLRFIRKCGEKLRKINKQLKMKSEQKPIRKTIKI
jgi:hypothetical protein